MAGATLFIDGVPVPDTRAAYALLRYLKKYGTVEQVTAVQAFLGADETLQITIEELDLPIYVYNSLKRERLDTVGDIAGRTKVQLLDIRNFGEKSWDALKEKLDGLGVSLQDH